MPDAGLPIADRKRGATAHRVASDVTICQHLLSQHLLQLGALLFQSLQLARIGNIHAAELGLVCVEGFRISMLAGRHRRGIVNLTRVQGFAA
ncbi:hypothetical protein Amn_pc00680 (plasmid) [Aminobacter sp. Y103A]|nr:hypothetical protein Amn_pc00680 [Aminobacter sp. SS-2016]